MLRIDPSFHDHFAEWFVQEFWNSDKPKYIFGRNEYAVSIANAANVDGFIDDFSQDKEYLGKPIIPVTSVPEGALVVVVVVGKPLTAEKRVRKFQFFSLNYYTFYKYSLDLCKNLHPIIFQENFSIEFYKNRGKFDMIYELLEDDISKNQFYNLINFRLSFNLYYLRGFSALEDQQYFEDFLFFGHDEIFVDVGCYDGKTTLDFVEKCKRRYRSIHCFEPEIGNFHKMKKNLSDIPRIMFYCMGLSDRREQLHFIANGSASCASEQGEICIEVDALDSILSDPVSFIKMDIEGGEEKALRGCAQIIRTHHPKLAISVYHRANDFWKIPELVFSIRDDYALYLRHYTEGKDETVMFFIPKSL